MPMRNHLQAAAGAALASVLAATLIAACGGSAPPPVMAHGVAFREPAADPRPYAAADTAFGLDLLGAWCRADPQANLVLSPSSLASGLGMAYLGARGGTARAMAATLHLPAAAQPSLEAGLQARSAALRALAGPGVTLQSSDQVWADPALRTSPSYLNAVATGYGAGVARVPLLNHPDQVIQQIDQAISAATRGHIPQLLAPGSLQDIGWVLTDALYLNAVWATPFQATQSGPGPFTTSAGRSVSAQFMNGGSYRAVTAGGWTAVWLPYRGGRLAMMALLPPAGDRGCTLPGAPAVGAMAAALASDHPGDVTPSVSLPRVNLSGNTSMNGLLSQLGMGVAFTPAADFTGLSPQAGYIGLVRHAATLQVGEKGTVASAATAVGVVPAAAVATSPMVTFDRPYLMLVTARDTGEPLFMARVADPDTH
jgi:serine protease inhibitor